VNEERKPGTDAQQPTPWLPPEATADGATLVVYDRQRAEEMLRTWTPQQLLLALRAGKFSDTLSAEEADELAALLDDWMRRALSLVTLRDALLIDRRRGTRVYSLLCSALTVERVPIAAGGHTMAGTAADTSSLLEQAHTEGLALACHAGASAHYPLPPNLETLLPTLPAPYRKPPLQFVPPTGLLRTIAITLVCLGMSVLVFPLLIGRVPDQPAGLPLGLLTLGLLVGIRAGWAGYIGSFLIWLVPNLPGFHYDTPLATLPAVIPLLVMGLVLLALDRHVRALWRWIWLRVRE
jgi:hypothetical protein